MIELSPPSHGQASIEQDDRPDVELATRGLAAAGPSVPAIHSIGIDASELGWITAVVAS